MCRYDDSVSPSQLFGLWGILNEGGKFRVVTLEHGLQERWHIGIGNCAAGIYWGRFARFCR
jgi:hypothetical protein